MRWGLTPSFTKGGKADPWRMFNARSEGVTTSPVFRRLVGTRRCVVLLDGFYEVGSWPAVQSESARVGLASRGWEQSSSCGSLPSR